MKRNIVVLLSVLLSVLYSLLLNSVLAGENRYSLPIDEIHSIDKGSFLMVKTIDRVSIDRYII